MSDEDEKAKLHSLTCATCGTLDTAEKWMRHLYALRGTTPEKQIAQTEKAAELIASKIKEIFP